MSLGITAVLAGGGYPQAIQITVAGLTAGDAFSVTAVSADGTAWTVRGGNGQLASDTTVVLADVSTPLRQAITYTAAQTGWSPVLSSPVTVPYSGRYVLQSLDGRVCIPFAAHDNADPRDLSLRSTLFEIPGRSTPVVRWDTSAGDSGDLLVRTTRTATDALRAQLRDAGPVMVLRTDGTLRDFKPVQFIVITRASSALWGYGDGPDAQRLWSLTYTEITDPEPSMVLAASNAADFDAAYAALTWTDFDAEWAALTGDDFDATDWATH